MFASFCEKLQYLKSSTFVIVFVMHISYVHKFVCSVNNASRFYLVNQQCPICNVLLLEFFLALLTLLLLVCWRKSEIQKWSM